MRYGHRRALAVALALMMSLALPLAGLGEAEGVYEGALDADGTRSGYGTWALGTARYEGEWANGLPNGAGTLYTGFDMDGDGVLDATLVVQGQWADALGEGEVLWSLFLADAVGAAGAYTAWLLHIAGGHVAADALLSGVNGDDEGVHGTVEMWFDQDVLYAGVPPWAQGALEE